MKTPIWRKKNPKVDEKEREVRIERKSGEQIQSECYPCNRLPNRCVLADQNIVNVLTEGRSVVVHVHEFNGYHGSSAERRVPAVPGLNGEVVVLTHLEVQIISHRNRA